MAAEVGADLGANRRLKGVGRGPLGDEPATCSLLATGAAKEETGTATHSARGLGGNPSARSLPGQPS